VLTNAVGFKESAGIKAGSKANKKCLTSSMNGGELIFDQGDALAFDNFIDNPILLFPGFGFGCDTPHVQVSWRGQSVNAGNRKLPIRLSIDFTDTTEWQDFQDHFTEVIDDDNAEYDTGPESEIGGRRSVVDLTEGGIYIFACSNYNDPIYDTFGGTFGAYGSIAAMAADIGGDNYILYTSATGAPPANFDTGFLVSDSGFSLNGTQLGNPSNDGPFDTGSNYYYFPRRNENFSTNISNAYKPNIVFTAAEATSVGYQTRPIGQNSLAFNNRISSDLIGSNSNSETYILSRLQAEGKYDRDYNGFVSGYGTLSIFNAFAFSPLYLGSLPPNQWPQFYEFSAPKPPESVPIIGQAPLDLISTYSDQIYGVQSHGIGSGRDATYSDTIENVFSGGGDTDFLFRLFSVNYRFYINAAGNTENINIRIRFQPDFITNNFKQGIADPSEAQRATIDGVLPEVTSPGDISLGTDSDSTDGEGTTGGGTSGGGTKADGTRVVSSASKPSKKTSSTQKKATTKYGY